jgi:hypothetical protein
LINKQLHGVPAQLRDVTGQLQDVTGRLLDVPAGLRGVTSQLRGVTGQLRGVTARLRHVTGRLRDIVGFFTTETQRYEGGEPPRHKDTKFFWGLTTKTQRHKGVLGLTTMAQSHKGDVFALFFGVFVVIGRGGLWGLAGQKGQGAAAVQWWRKQGTCFRYGCKDTKARGGFFSCFVCWCFW